MNFHPHLNEVYDLLAAEDGWPDTKHRFEETHVYAVQAAIACRRPLLIRGEPGIGKSQLARAAAKVMGVPYLRYTMTAQTECTDLLYMFDAVARLAQAQVLGHVGDSSNWREDLAVERFVEPGLFWWALNWKSAQTQWELYVGEEQDTHESKAVSCPHRRPPAWQPDKGGCVLLVDEIDKAEGDVPNALLESFGAYAFDVDVTAQHVTLPEECGAVSETYAPPLVVVTTNEERELPRAFVRRCLVLQMDFEECILERRGRDHFEGKIAEGVYAAAVEQLMADRKASAEFGPVLPGVAEFLDLLRILADSPKSAQRARLDQVRDFVGAKNPKQHRRRATSE